jgi:hypothetical protein
MLDNNGIDKQNQNHQNIKENDYPGKNDIFSFPQTN